jgi:hypothetical protein
MDHSRCFECTYRWNANVESVASLHCFLITSPGLRCFQFSTDSMEILLRVNLNVGAFHPMPLKDRQDKASTRDLVNFKRSVSTQTTAR